MSSGAVGGGGGGVGVVPTVDQFRESYRNCLAKSQTSSPQA